MCGRAMGNPGEGHEFTEQLSLTDIDWGEWGSNWNLSPGQRGPVVVEDWTGARQLVGMVWGLAQKDTHSSDIKPFNARSETIDRIPRFSRLLPTRRCIVPASGWYEWRAEGRRKQPYFAHPTDRAMFGFAGIYDAWREETGEIAGSYCIITTTPTPDLAPLHNRMPVILAPEDYDLWLSKRVTELGAIQHLLRPYDRASVNWWPVSRKVDNIRSNSPDLPIPCLDGAELRGTLPLEVTGTLAPRQAVLFG